jgi:hypothetical protein
MSARDFDVWISVIRKDGRADKIRETLEIAAGALTLTAAGPYSHSRAVVTAASGFRNAVDIIDGSRLVSDERTPIVTALRRAASLLMAIQVAAQHGDSGARVDAGIDAGGAR